VTAQPAPRLARPAVILLVAMLVVATTACTGDRDGEQPAPPAAGDAAGDVSWQPCPELVAELIGDVAPESVIEELTEQVAYDCATVPVPQDWANPQSPETFDISVVRARSNDQQDRIGSLLVNPGGPGASGIETAVFLSFGSQVGGLPDGVLERFDIVGFDPRGVGRSSPIECFTDSELDDAYAAEPDPVEQADFDALVTRTRQQAETCAAKYGGALPLVSTEQAAHDMDALRAAVGDEKLTYLGFSYGSLLGAVYAQLYPQRIRALVLDGAVDPEQDSVASSEQQAQGFERAMDNFAAWCDQSPDECPLQPDARTAIEAALDDARQSPVSGEDGRDATAGWVFTAVISALYSRDFWEPLAAALDQLAGGDPTGVFDLADSYAQRATDGTYTNLYDANLAINCADDAGGVTVEQVRQLQGEWREAYPMFGAPLATSVLNCALWSAPADPYPVGPAAGAPPILVVGTLGDPATPYEATGRLASMLGTGVVLTWEGEGHTAYPETPCISDAVDAYLIDLTVPAEGTTCPA
jgi:pimeloyl-ACP methyl ester carboxylesterase